MIFAGLLRTPAAPPVRITAPGPHHPVRKTTPAPAPPVPRSTPRPYPGAENHTRTAPARTTAAPPGSPWEIGPDTARALAKNTPELLAKNGLGFRLVEPGDRNPGTCAMFDTRLGMPCRAVARDRAEWSARAFMPVCTSHAHALTHCAKECEEVITVRIGPVR